MGRSVGRSVGRLFDELAVLSFINFFRVRFSADGDSHSEPYRDPHPVRDQAGSPVIHRYRVRYYVYLYLAVYLIPGITAIRGIKIVPRRQIFRFAPDHLLAGGTDGHCLALEEGVSTASTSGVTTRTILTYASRLVPIYRQ